jgi:acyl-CoA hydrolase
VASVSDTYIENRERVQPGDANNYGSAHGGIVATWMDEVGAMSAMRHAGETCVIPAACDGTHLRGARHCIVPHSPRK